MKKLILSLFIFITLFAAASFAEDAAVTLCQFPVTVNGQEVNLKTGEYPFITYRDITYMPLTYDMCRFAGISLRDMPDGYFISASLPEAGGFSSQTAQVKSVTAQFPERPAYIMENRLENYYRDAELKLTPHHLCARRLTCTGDFYLTMFYRGPALESFFVFRRGGAELFLELGDKVRAVGKAALLCRHGHAFAACEKRNGMRHPSLKEVFSR